MSSKLLAFVTAAILFSFFAATSYGTKAAYADDTWWVGKGAKADTYMNYKIVYLSGREEIFRPQTETFLRKFHCPPGELFMRRKGDPRKDWIVKSELFDANVRDRYKVKWVFDDRPQVLRMWQKMGLVTFAVGNLEEF